MTEPWQGIITERFNAAKAKVEQLLNGDGLTFRGLEQALLGLTLEQRLEIKQGLAKAGLKP
jgi:hypothetical protein